VAGAGRIAHAGRVRTPLAVVALVAALTCAASVVAFAAPARNGLPAYTDGYTRWAKLNRRPVTTPGAHTGVKNVYASKARRTNGRFPNGTVIVKAIREPRTRGLPAQVAVMRKIRGRWRWVEYSRSGGRYGVLAKGALCTSCHVQARATDWVFTTR
jgi:hypothetical protein